MKLMKTNKKKNFICECEIKSEEDAALPDEVS